MPTNREEETTEHKEKNYKLRWYRDGLLLATIDGREWVIDTGCPNSLGEPDTLTIAGKQFCISNRGHVGMNGLELSNQIGTNVAGLLGMNVLGDLDLILNPDEGVMTASTGSLAMKGHGIRVSFFPLFPIVSVSIKGKKRKMIFDTGAEISFFNHPDRESFPQEGEFVDFYPTLGDFTTPTNRVEIDFQGRKESIRCGILPNELRPLLSQLHGVVGSELAKGRSLGVFARRNWIVMGTRICNTSGIVAASPYSSN